MSTKIPRKVRKEIRDFAFAEADKHQYLLKSKNENAAFLDRLVKHQKVGGRLREYMPEERVKSYVKDAVINKYSKRERVLPRDITSLISKRYRGVVHEISYDKEKAVSLHRIEAGPVVAASRSAYIKWETGLRKLLLYVAAAPGLPPSDGTPMKLLLIIYQHGNPVNQSDRSLTERGLNLVDVDCAWVD
jgi:hypothetical protein